MADNENPLAGFPFDKLPTELLVKIFHQARTDNVLDDWDTKYSHPVTLSHVCRHWRKVALSAPTLWTNIRIVQCDNEKFREAARVYLERSKACPVFLTWFSDLDQPYTDIQGVINNLIIPRADRWQRITLLAKDNAATDALLTVMESLDFPILQDLEISCMLEKSSPLSGPAFCRSAPLLRRCRLDWCCNTPSFPPLPSNLVVLDFTFSAVRSKEFDLDPLFKFLPHVAHSLEHLRFIVPPASEVRFTPRASRIPLKHLKSLLIKDPRVIMDRISTPNLTYLTVSCPHDATDAAKMFEGFSTTILRSIQFDGGPLRPILNAHHFPSIFPQLESVTSFGCTGELAFVLLLEPPEPKSSSSQKAPKHWEVQNPFPNLKELTMSDTTIWASLQAAIEKRLENGDKSLRKIRLPKVGATAKVIMLGLRRWLLAYGIELVLYEPGVVSISTPEFQDDFCDEETGLFLEIMKRRFRERTRYISRLSRRYKEGYDTHRDWDDDHD